MKTARDALAPIVVGFALLALGGCSTAKDAGGGATSSPGLDGGGVTADGGDVTSPDGPDGGSALNTGEGGATFTTGDGDGGIRACSGGVVGDNRPVEVRTFAGYDCKKPSPLVILLHDYGSTGALEDAYVGISAQADALGFLYVHPDGTKDAQGQQFWNATDACCNVGGSTIDDSTYLFNVIVETTYQYNVDPNRIYILGHGNGGFMAYRVACDHSLYLTAVADLGGATWADSSKCLLQSPVSVLEIHGTSDAVFAYDGGTDLAAYPSAPTTIQNWVTLDQCSVTAGTARTNLNLDSTLPGAETTVTQWSCDLGFNAALWGIQGGTHVPTLSATFTPSLLGFLLAQSKP